MRFGVDAIACRARNISPAPRVLTVEDSADTAVAGRGVAGGEVSGEDVSSGIGSAS